jgi:parallel beta-helix repeat protein
MPSLTLGNTLITSTGVQLNYLNTSTSPIQSQLDGKQATLLAGTNIKTINGITPLGAGNMVIGTGGTMVYPGIGIALSTGSTWGTSITDNSANWNTAYTDRLKWDGGATGLTAATGRTSLGGTTVGSAFFTLTNPSAITIPLINANNTVSALSAANFKTALSLTSADVGLPNATNESKATMFTSPALTGTPTAPTATTGTNTTQIATTAFVLANSSTTYNARVDSIVKALKDTTSAAPVLLANNGGIIPPLPNGVTPDTALILYHGAIYYYTTSTPVSSYPTYYISTSSGNDSNDGLSPATPWLTITKVNSSMASLVPGSAVKFNKGNTFYGEIIPATSGSSGLPITFGAYGTGAAPIITGLTTITGWGSEGSGVYSKTISCQSNPNLLVINGKEYAMGRYPKAGTNAIYTSHSTNVSITDANLNSAVTNWTGAEVVIRYEEYDLDRCSITNHSSHTLTYTNISGDTETPTDGYYYFIQNDLRTLGTVSGAAPVFGEWYYSGTKLYVYFGVDPSTYTVQLPTLDRLFYANTSYGYITVDGLSFKGANGEAVYVLGGYETVKNCSVNFTGRSGIYTNSVYGLIDNNVINHTNTQGVSNLAVNATITNNTIKNIGTIEGIALQGWTTSGIEGSAANVLIQYNKIDSIGANGVHFVGNNTAIRNNVISNFALVMNDKGGINTDGWTPYTGEVIDGNICFNGIGHMGLPTYGYSVSGIYLDSYAGHITVTNNTLFNNSLYGINLQNPNNITMQYNTCYNNGEGSLNITEWSAGTVSNITMLDNILFANFTTSQELYPSLLWAARGTTIANVLTADRNYYCAPYAGINSITSSVYPANFIWWTLAGWQSYTGQDANSHNISQTVDNANKLHIIYNGTKANQTYTLSAAMVDAANTTYSGTVTLLPWKSLVLIGAGTVTQN